MFTKAIEPSAGNSSFRERLSGETVFDSFGEPVEPSRAMAFEPSVLIPSMLADRELNYLHWLASTLNGTGRVVELGCFLGGSTAALVGGIRNSKHPSQSLLTYDAFVIPDSGYPGFLSWIRSYGLEPSQHFRDRFNEFNRQWLDAIVVRDGWIPPAASKDQEHEIYPEQDPIELLFVDIAKTWDVNLSVLRTFGKHLHIGATIVQQDFIDFQTPWIPLHMWQLRHVFEPLDAIHGTSTCSFRCVDDPGESIDQLWTASDFQEQAMRREVWGCVHQYWCEKIGKHAAGFIYGHAAMHALACGDDTDAARYGRMYERWSRLKESKGIYFSPSWPDLVESMPSILSSRNCDSQATRVLAAECAARGTRTSYLSSEKKTSYCPKKRRKEVWTNVFDRIAKDGHTRVALFGGGQHTSWLLSEFSFDQGIELVCIIDDHPTCDFIKNVPVRNSETAVADLSGATILLPSSDAYETQMFNRIHKLFNGLPDLKIERVYTHADAIESVGLSWQYAVDTSSERLHSSVCPLALSGPKIPKTLAQRERLGLNPDRFWIQTLLDFFTPPDWTKGSITRYQTAFLWDIIEASRPKTIVEIGTASGVSTAMLLKASELFCPDDGVVYSYDVSSYCYFDPRRLLGSAIGEIAPDLVDRAFLYACANASDAASCFTQGEVDMAFIDGNHAHPAPTVDLLSIIYALKPGAWVVLHDIELCNIYPDRKEARWHHTGPHCLFNSWPFEKIQLEGDTPADRNIGAIRMPDSPIEALPHLLEALRGPWELQESDLSNILKALAILDGRID